MKRLIVIVTLVIVIIVISGCASSPINTDAQNGNFVMESLPTLTSNDGVKYKIVTIEGRQFIATQGAYRYWQFAPLLP